MKTPEEIKKGLNACMSEMGEQCGYCPYYLTAPCQSVIAEDALIYIYRLESLLAQRARLLATLGVTVPKEG